MYEDKNLEEPIKRKKLGTIIRKGGEWNADHTQCDPYDTIEGYVLETTHSMLKESYEFQRKDNIELRKVIEELKTNTKPDEEEDSKDYLNIMKDILRLDKYIRRLENRDRKSKSDDVTVRCGNAISIMTHKKLILIQSVTHIKDKLKGKDHRFNDAR